MLNNPRKQGCSARERLRLAVGLGPIVLAGLPSGLLGVRLGLTLGERPGLSLAGTEGRVDLTTEALVFGLQVAEASLKGLAAGTRNEWHTYIMGEAGVAAELTATEEQGSA